MVDESGAEKPVTDVSLRVPSKRPKVGQEANKDEIKGTIGEVKVATSAQPFSRVCLEGMAEEEKKERVIIGGIGVQV